MTLVPWEINKFCSPRNSMPLLASPQEKLRLIKKQNKLISGVSVTECLLCSTASYPFF